MSGQMVKNISLLVRRPRMRLLVSSSVRSARGVVGETGKPVKKARKRHKVSGNITRMEILVSMLSTMRWARESI